MAKLAYPARVVSLILSDVVGDSLDIIASGPTVVCREDPKEAVKVSKFNIFFSGLNWVIKIIVHSDNLIIQPSWVI